MKFTAETVIQRKNEMPFCEVGDEIVLLDSNNGLYLNFNKVATCIWQILENPVSLFELCAYLQDQFAISQERCTSEVSEFLDILLNKELISVQLRNYS